MKKSSIEQSSCEVHRKADEAEAELLGESVYHSDIPMVNRWKDPNCLPGRITEIHSNRIIMVVALHDPNTAKRVFVTEMSKKEFKNHAGWKPVVDEFFVVNNPFDSNILIRQKDLPELWAKPE